jgi:hypothetical protein
LKEIAHVRNVVSRVQGENNVNAKVDKKWCDVFQVLKINDTEYRNFEVIVSYALAVPSTNAVVERIFSVVHLWTDDK